MIVVRTPFRVSFLGGGTDYMDWTEGHEGRVLSMAIRKYAYHVIREIPSSFRDRKFQIDYAKHESVETLEEIQHPAARACLQSRGWPSERPLSIYYTGDLPSRSGIGSSSAFTVGLLRGLHALKGTMPHAEDLAREAINVEQQILQEKVGVQDQLAVAYGGLNRIRIQRDWALVERVTLPDDITRALEQHLHLIWVGPRQKTASEVAAGYDFKRRTLRTLTALVEEGVQALVNGRLEEFANLVTEGYQLKLELSGEKDTPAWQLIHAAIKKGAWGGKGLGAGGGGFALIVGPPGGWADRETWSLSCDHTGSIVVWKAWP